MAIGGSTTTNPGLLGLWSNSLYHQGGRGRHNFVRQHFVFLVWGKTHLGNKKPTWSMILGQLIVNFPVIVYIYIFFIYIHRCTTVDGRNPAAPECRKNPVNIWINYLATSAGFLPSTVAVSVQVFINRYLSHLARLVHHHCRATILSTQTWPGFFFLMVVGWELSWQHLKRLWTQYEISSWKCFTFSQINDKMANGHGEIHSKLLNIHPTFPCTQQYSKGTLAQIETHSILSKLYTWNPNDTCFGGLTSKDRRQLSSKYVFIL